jgi:PPM family protein phosphatase
MKLGPVAGLALARDSANDMTEDDHLPPEGERRRVLSYMLDAGPFEPRSVVVAPEFGASSRAGRHRPANEDHFLILRMARSQEVIASSLQQADLPGRFDEFGYFMAVADGSGSFGGGALASRVALSTLAHMAIRFGKWNVRIDKDTVESVVRQADLYHRRTAQAIEQFRMAAPFLSTMRSTLTAVFTAGDTLFFTHVGDSRAYLLRHGSLTQLTRDNTKLQAVDGVPVFDIERFPLEDNDLILLCTNGLTRTLDDDAIADLLSHPRGVEDQCRQLVTLAAAADADDDITAVAARYRVPPPPEETDKIA